jgi:CBS domain containing-hemolysin-like protein
VLDYVEYEILAIIILVGLYALFSGLEIAIVGVRRSKVIRLYNKKIPGSAALYKLKLNPGRMTAGVNLGNTLVNVASSVLAADVAIKLLGNQGVGIAIGIMTCIILIFGEIAPKTYCNVNPEKVSLRFSRVILAFTYITYPIVILLENFIKFMLKAAGGSTTLRPITETEIEEVLDQALHEKAIEKEEHELARNALEFDDQSISNVMTRREQIFSLSEQLTLEKALPLIKNRGYTRVPIFKKNKDNIIGIVHIWNIVRVPEKDYKKTRLKDILRKPLYVDSTEKISQLLLKLKKKDTHIAIVVDESDNLQGIITMEDLLEEIVGDIMGEMKRR